MKAKKFKKLIMSFWFWVLIAVISYLIFVLIPVTWTDGLVWDNSVGLNLYKTIFAYITQIAWIMVIVVLIIDAIKWVHKTKIEDYWKVSLTILGIVGIIAYVIYSISGWAVFNDLTQGYDDRIGDLENEDKIRVHLRLLEKDGYEIFYFGYLDFDSTISTDTALIKMNSFGNRKEQVNSALFSLSQVYPNAPEYTIKILEEKQECTYKINGDSRRAVYEKSIDFDTYEFDENGELIVTEEITRSNELYQVLQYQKENPICS